MNIWTGLRVMQSNFAVETVDPVLSWVDRVIAWNPCNSELLPQPTIQPCAYKLGGDVIVVHPTILAEMQRSSLIDTLSQ